MLVLCGQTRSEIGAPFPDVVLFPEYARLADITNAQAPNPSSLVIGAVEEEDQNKVLRSRAVIFHHGENRIDYLKIGTDGRTQGTNHRPERLPVYRSGAVCVGVVLCMDVQDEAFVREVADALKSAPASFKLLCIPAAMSASTWNWSDPLGSKWEGVHVLLCNNHQAAYKPGCKS